MRYYIFENIQGDSTAARLALADLAEDHPEFYQEISRRENIVKMILQSDAAAPMLRRIADLENRIALVDLRLNAADALALTPAQRQALWRERVNLMQSLLQVEYAQLQSPGY